MQEPVGGAAGEAGDKGTMIAKYRIEASGRLEKTGRLTKLTSVRKGMGKARYSTLITSIPVEMSRALGIGPGDNLVWNLSEGAATMSVTKFEAKALYSTEALYSKMLQLRKLAKGNETVREFAEREIKRLEELGPIKKLPAKELEKEREAREEAMRRKWLEKKKKERAGGGPVKGEGS